MPLPRHPAPSLVLAALLTALAAAGCANNPYLQSKEYTSEGGQMATDTAAAAGRLDTAQRTNVSLNQQARDQDAQIKADQARIDDLQSTLDRQQKALADALSKRKLTQARYDQLKKQVDDLRAETRAADMQNKSRAMAKPGTAADPEQQARLRQLEKRRADLEAALAKLAG